MKIVLCGYLLTEKRAQTLIACSNIDDVNSQGNFNLASASVKTAFRGNSLIDGDLSTISTSKVVCGSFLIAVP